MGKIENVRTLQIELDPPLFNFFTFAALGGLNMSFRSEKSKESKTSFLSQIPLLGSRRFP